MNVPTKPDFDDSQGYPQYDRGKKWPVWFTIAIPFIGFMALLFRQVRSVCWPAIGMVVVVFELATFFIEHHAIVMGHWVYNEAKVLGIKLWDIPIEEPLVYYLLPPVFVILVMLVVYERLTKNTTAVNQDKKGITHE